MIRKQKKMKRLNKMIVCLGGVLVFSMGLNFSVQTIYAQENVAIVDEGENGYQHKMI